jgi:hypothetical protein
MIALAKRVNARSGVTSVTADAGTEAIQSHGPRNQPKRKAKKK